MEIGKTVVCEYGATGEGLTYMVLVCLAEDANHAIKRFGEIFDNYFATGAEVYDGLRFDLPACKLLISDRMQESLTKIYNGGNPTGNISFHASFHMNFS